MNEMSYDALDSSSVLMSFIHSPVQEYAHVMSFNHLQLLLCFVDKDSTVKFPCYKVVNWVFDSMII